MCMQNVSINNPDRIVMRLSRAGGAVGCIHGIEIAMFVVLGARWKEGRPACLDVCMLEGLWVSGDIPAGWDLAHGLYVDADFAL